MSFNEIVISEKKSEVDIDFSEFENNREAYLADGHLSGTKVDYKMINALTDIVGDRQFEDLVDEVLQMPKIYAFDKSELKYLEEIIDSMRQMLEERGLSSYNNKFVLVHLVCCTIDWAMSEGYVKSIEGNKVELEHCLEYINPENSNEVDIDFSEFQNNREEYLADGHLSGTQVDYNMIKALTDIVGDSEFEDLVDEVLQMPKIYESDEYELKYLVETIDSMRQMLEERGIASYNNKFVLVHLICCTIDWDMCGEYVKIIGSTVELEQCLQYINPEMNYISECENDSENEDLPDEINYKLTETLIDIVCSDKLDYLVDDVIYIARAFAFNKGEMKYLFEVIEFMKDILKDKKVDFKNNKFSLVHLVRDTIEWVMGENCGETMRYKKQLKQCIEFLQALL